MIVMIKVVKNIFGPFQGEIIDDKTYTFEKKNLMFECSPLWNDYWEN